MKTNILMERENEKNLSDALARGALLWAPLYSIGATTTSFVLSAENPAETQAFSDLLMKALFILSPACMLAETAGWLVFSKYKQLKRLGDRKAPLPKLPHYVPPLVEHRLMHMGHA